MRNTRGVTFILGAVLLLVTACDSGNTLMNPSPSETNAAAGEAGFMKTGRTQIWADGRLFDSIVTPASFKPGSGNFDILYNGSFKDGIGHISESKPGDQDYNGGRWSVYVLKNGVDPAKYTNADSDTDLDMNDFKPAGVYFECPLLPRK